MINLTTKLTQEEISAKYGHLQLMDVHEVQEMMDAATFFVELPVGKHMATIVGQKKFTAKSGGEYLKLYVEVDSMLSELFIGSVDGYGTICGRLTAACRLPKHELSKVFGCEIPIWVQEKYSPESGKTYRNLWFTEPPTQQDQVPVMEGTTRRPNMADIK